MLVLKSINIIFGEKNNMLNQTKIFITLIILSISNCIYSQGDIKIEFTNDAELIKKGYSNIVVYKLLGDSIYYRKDKFKIKYPKKIPTQNLGYFFSYFDGNDSSKIQKIYACLISDYKSMNAKIWVDQNGNLDFSDDSETYTLNNDSSVIINLYNQKEEGAVANLLLKKLTLSQINDTTFNNYFGIVGKNKNGVYVEENKFWFASQSLACKKINARINNQYIKIGLYDYNWDGTFDNIGTDLIMISEDTLKELFTSVLKGATVLSDTTLLMIGETVYELKEISYTGKSITLEISNIPFEKPIGIGSTLPEFKIEFLDSTSSIINTEFSKYDYTIIDIWGSWCGGCTFQLPKLQSIYRKYQDKVSVLGLNYGDSNKNAIKYIIKHDIKWQNGKLSKEFKDKVPISSYPTFIVVDNKGKMILITSGTLEISEFLENKFTN